MQTSRRRFMQGTAAAAAAASVPYVWTSRSANAADAQDKPKVAAIGVGGSRGRYNQGGAVAMQASSFGDMVAVCDVDEQHNDEFSARFDNKLKKYVDYRELLEKEKPEAVTIGTPDHWHVPIAIAALRAGADVYCEKPLTLTIDEGKEICKVVKETGRTFQVGTQQRSENGDVFLKAIALAQGGYLGDNVNAIVAISGSPTGGPFQASAPPDGLHWDFWLGPAREADYSEQRRKEFRWFFDYSGGKMTDWGAHHIDIAQWALGKELSGPTKISGQGKFTPQVPENFDFAAYFEGKAELPSAFNTATTFDIDLTYDNGAVMKVTDHYKGEGAEFDNGILLVGDKGRIFVNRGRLSGKPFEDLDDAGKKEIDEAVVKLYRGMPRNGGHMGNFFNCRETKVDPISDVYTHHRTMTACHLCNINLMVGRDLQWDPVNEQFVGDEQATALMKRPGRDKYLG